MERLTCRDSKGLALSTHPLVENWSIYPSKYCKKIVDKLAEYEDAEESGLLLRLPCRVGATVYVLAKCKDIAPILDGATLGTSTGYHCPYDLNEKCPHVDCDCEDAKDKLAIFEDKVNCIVIEMFDIWVTTLTTNIGGYVGNDIYLTREEAEAALKEREV